MKARLQKLVLLLRGPLKLGFFLFATVLSYYFALGLRFDFSPGQIFSGQRWPFPVLLLMLLRHGAYMFWGLHSSYWRHSSTRDLKNIVIAHAFSALVFAAGILFFRVQEFPRAVIFIELCLSILLAGGSRLITRMLCEEFFSDVPKHLLGDVKEIVILGGGTSGHLLVKILHSKRRFGYRPLLVLDDNEGLQGVSIHGVKVSGRLSQLEQVLIANPNISSVVLAIPSLSRERITELENICRNYKVPLKRLQSFEDIALRDALSEDGPFSVEAILDRPVTVQHEKEVRSHLFQKRILVTGGGGSIGSELVRQILPYEPSEIVFFDSCEYNLFRVELEFSKIYPSVAKRYVVGNICDQGRLEQVFREESPQYVFHAAAYKHVPMMESNCSQALLTNVIGTQNVLDVCSAFGVERFVLISTDKAIDPSSVMGCSKRLAEWVVSWYSNARNVQSALGERRLGTKPVNTAVVRFGNVINSAGSVIPLFREQILSGGPITVTHPDIERFFMSLQEAARLVLTAGILGERGEVYVLDMGKKIKIVEVAKKMLALYGRSDIPIIFTGLRPGEKLTEILHTTHETLSDTAFQKVSRVLGPKFEINILEAIEELRTFVHSIPDLEIGQRMHKLVLEIQAEQVEQLEAAHLQVPSVANL